MHISFLSVWLAATFSWRNDCQARSWKEGSGEGKLQEALTCSPAQLINVHQWEMTVSEGISMSSQWSSENSCNFLRTYYWTLMTSCDYEQFLVNCENIPIACSFRTKLKRWSHFKQFTKCFICHIFLQSVAQEPQVNLQVLSPGQTDSQVNASFGLAFNLRFVWPPTCVDFGRAQIWTQVFNRLATQRKSTQVDRK